MIAFAIWDLVWIVRELSFATNQTNNLLEP